MADNERDFKGVWIPKEVWLDKRLNMLEKGILTEIDSLDQGERGCFASNKHIAEFCQCSESAVSKAVSKLTELGYIYVQSFDGRLRELKSRLSNNKIQTSKIYEADLYDLRESNTSNNTSINTKSKKKESKKATFDELINAFTENEEERELLKEWLRVRKAKRAAMTNRAIELNLNKLQDLASKSNMSVTEYLQEVICRGWAAFFEIKNYNKQPQQSQPNNFIDNLMKIADKECDIGGTSWN